MLISLALQFRSDDISTAMLLLRLLISSIIELFLLTRIVHYFSSQTDNDQGGNKNESSESNNIKRNSRAVAPTRKVLNKHQQKQQQQQKKKSSSLTLPLSSIVRRSGNARSAPATGAETNGAPAATSRKGSLTRSSHRRSNTNDHEQQEQKQQTHKQKVQKPIKSAVPAPINTATGTTRSTELIPTTIEEEGEGEDDSERQTEYYPFTPEADTPKKRKNRIGKSFKKLLRSKSSADDSSVQSSTLSELNSDFGDGSIAGRSNRQKRGTRLKKLFKKGLRGLSPKKSSSSSVTSSASISSSVEQPPPQWISENDVAPLPLYAAVDPTSSEPVTSLNTDGTGPNVDYYALSEVEEEEGDGGDDDDDEKDEEKEEKEGEERQQSNQEEVSILDPALQTSVPQNPTGLEDVNAVEGYFNFSEVSDEDDNHEKDEEVRKDDDDREEEEEEEEEDKDCVAPILSSSMTSEGGRDGVARIWGTGEDMYSPSEDVLRRSQLRVSYLETKLKEQIRTSFLEQNERTEQASSLRRSRRRATLLASQLKSLMDEEETFEEEKFDQDEFEAELHVPGAGVYVLWQLGVMEYIRDHYDLTKIHVTGASAGAFSAVFAMTRIDLSEFAEYLALLTTVKYKVYDRTLGIMGVITDIFRDCLEKLLPESSHEMVNNVSILVTDASSHQIERVSGFSGRESVSGAVLASMHIPFLNNGRYSTPFRKKAYYDGALLASPKDFQRDETRPSVIIDRNEDRYFDDKTLLDCVKTVPIEEAFNLMEAGRNFAKRLEDEGRFDCFPKAPGFDSDGESIGWEGERSSLTELEETAEDE